MKFCIFDEIRFWTKFCILKGNFAFFEIWFRTKFDFEQNLIFWTKFCILNEILHFEKKFCILEEISSWQIITLSVEFR